MDSQAGPDREEGLTLPGGYRLSSMARLDLFDIVDYTLATWGEEQALRYLDGLEECFRLLAESPEIGRACEGVRPGYRRHEHQKHAIFYRADGEGVLIGRILHQRMLPNRRLLDESSADQ